MMIASMPPIRMRMILLTIVSLIGIISYQLLHAPLHEPKPKGHLRIGLPTPSYRLLTDPLPYTFAVSNQAIIQHHTATCEHDWIDIYYPDFDATIHVTYKPVNNNPQLLNEYCNEAYKLTALHQIKASAIEENSFRTPQGNTIVTAVLSGPVPSPFQFYVTNGTTHFLRGALYFNTAQDDFLAPIIDFIIQDIKHLLHTLQWRNTVQIPPG